MCTKQYVCVCVCVCARAHARARAFVCMRVHVHVCVCVCVCVCLYTCSQEAAKPSTRALAWRNPSYLAQGSFCL